MRGFVIGLVVGAFAALIFQPYIFPDGFPNTLERSVRDLFGR